MKTKKFLARVSSPMGYTEMLHTGLDDAVRWLGSCEHDTGVVYRNSTSRLMYKIERGLVVVNHSSAATARMERHRQGLTERPPVPRKGA